MDYKVKILIVDDEPDIIEFLKYNLEKHDFEVASANNGLTTIHILKTFKPQFILLDVMMPDMDGIETCQEIRKLKEFEKTFILFLTARGEDYSQIAGFEAGADDYIVKPIKPKVLISRINAFLKRLNTNNTIIKNSVEIPETDLVIDKDSYTVFNKGKELFLPRKEFELLMLITSKPNRLFSREEIFNHLWGTDTFVGERTLDVYICKLRNKIGDEYFKTIKGVGYKYIP